MASNFANILVLPVGECVRKHRHEVLLDSGHDPLDEAYYLHDLKNQLQVAGSALTIVQRDIEQKPLDRAAPVIAIAHDALNKARAVIITLTDRKIGGNDTLHCDVDKILTDMLPMIRVVMGSDVQIDLDSAAPYILDAHIARQCENALLNIALNAREAMPDGGRLHVTSRVVAGAEPGDRSSLCISVRDTGIGMDAQALTLSGRGRFTARPDCGGGLGLSSIRDFARSVGGRLDIESEKGVGTTVRLQLPL